MHVFLKNIFKKLLFLLIKDNESQLAIIEYPSRVKSLPVSLSIQVSEIK